MCFMFLNGRSRSRRSLCLEMVLWVMAIVSRLCVRVVLDIVHQAILLDMFMCSCDSWFSSVNFFHIPC
jgi:hypothetical protein